MYRVVDKGEQYGCHVYEVDTAMFPYYVNCGMEFLRVQDQRNMIVSIWQKEDGEECFTQKSFVNNGVRIMVKGDGVKYQGDVVDKEKSDGSIESIIQWDGDHPDEQVHNADASFVRKTYRVYVSDDSIRTVCYDGKYDSNKKYVYTEWDEKGKLKSRGLVFGDLREVYPFKEFKDGEMKEYEYDYDVKNGAIDKETRKEIHRGKYVNSMKKGYPRDDNPQKVPSDGANAEDTQERLPSADATGTNDLIQSVGMRANPSGFNGEESPIYYSSTKQENGVGEKVDEGKKEGGNDSHGSDDSTIPVTNRYSSITTIEDIGVNCEHIHLEKCYNYRGILSLSKITGLVSVAIDDDSLNRVTLITFISMSQLESITIGARSFTTATGLSIENCARLESLKIGPHSFSNATSFKVMNCQNLKSITVGNSDAEFSDNFMICDDLVLSNLPALETILFGMYSFNKTKKAEFTDLLTLKAITVGSNACHGVIGSSLTMTNLPCVKTINSQYSGFMSGFKNRNITNVSDTLSSQFPTTQHSSTSTYP
ncbi:hypothetical protein WA577_006597, partial [Blastocystis sp. JDR]